MDKKSLQKERIRNYFITAAKDLIRSEGIVVVTARNVADRAGYSYATLYNYFKDIRDLIFHCIEDFMEECRSFVESRSAEFTPGRERLLAVSRHYVQFFIQYPGIFELLYEQELSDIASRSSDIQQIDLFFNILTEKDWKRMSEQNKIINPDQRHEYYKMAVHGLMLHHLKRRKAFDFNHLMQEIESLMDVFCPAI